MLQTKFQTTEISVLNILKQWKKILPQKEFGIMICKEK